jgi:hypothetical protein
MTRNEVLLLGLLGGALAGVACSSGGSSTTGGAGRSGSGGGAAGTGGTSATGGAGTTGTAGDTGSAGAGGAGGGFANPGVCGERGMAVVSTTDYQGWAEFYIIGDSGLGVDVCTIRYDVKRVGDAPAGCVDPVSGAACAWEHLVAFSNPMVTTNTGGACDASDSQPPLDAAGRAQIATMMVGRGFSHAAAHGDSLMKYDGTKWTVVGHSSWDQTSGNFGYDIRTGNCNYGH